MYKTTLAYVLRANIVYAFFSDLNGFTRRAWQGLMCDMKEKIVDKYDFFAKTTNLNQSLSKKLQRFHKSYREIGSTMKRLI